MTQLLEKVFSEVSKLPELEQNALAKLLLKELSSQRRWDKAFAESEDLLGNLADDALKEHEKGQTNPLDPDTL